MRGVKRYGFVVDPISYMRMPVKDDGENRPVDWHDVVRDTAHQLSDRPIIDLRLRTLLRPSNKFISWNPTLTILLAALLRRNLSYLCWGLPSHSNHRIEKIAKALKLRTILKLANKVFVNDKESAAEIAAWTGCTPILIPYVVDGEFYSYRKYRNRKNFILVPGNNGRDESLVQSLLQRGHKIVRMTRDSVVAKRYSNITSDNFSLQYRVTYGKVARLYQQASAVALPLRARNHAAGQTAVLEALSCGAPVIISRGRASGIVSKYESVLVCDDLTPATWEERISQARRLGQLHPSTLERTAATIRSVHNPSAVSDVLRSLLSA